MAWPLEHVVPSQPGHRRSRQTRAVLGGWRQDLGPLEPHPGEEASGPHPMTRWQEGGPESSAGQGEVRLALGAESKGPGRFPVTSDSRAITWSAAQRAMDPAKPLWGCCQSQIRWDTEEQSRLRAKHPRRARGSTVPWSLTGAEFFCKKPVSLKPQKVRADHARKDREQRPAHGWQRSDTRQGLQVWLCVLQGPDSWHSDASLASQPKGSLLFRP